MLPDHLVLIHAIFSLLSPKRAFVRLQTTLWSVKPAFFSCCSACIDCCRAKFGESAFLEVYQKLYEAPDPAAVLISAAVSIQAFNRMFTSHHLLTAGRAVLATCFANMTQTPDCLLMASGQNCAACSTNTAVPHQAVEVWFAMPKHTIACTLVIANKSLLTGHL